MSTPAAKRRRIITASNTLSKPFRSPFKTSSKIDTANPTTPQPTSTESLSASQIPTVEPTSVSSLPKRRSFQAKQKYISPISAAALNNDPDIAPLLRAQRELEKQLRELKEQLDTAEQARKIEVDSKKKHPDGDVVDGELSELIEKWTAASRQAAEEMFGTVRDRVNRMGGPRAWKEMQKRQQEFQNTWDQDEQGKTNDGDDSQDEESNGVEKRDLYAEYDVDPETENEKAQRADTGEDPGQEDEFTMAMMLRTLNVDLKVIGYDRKQERWVD